MAADLFISAGEASGDLQASLLVGALRRISPQLRVRAVGGERLRAAGADVVIDSVAAGWASIGHLRAYLKIPWLLGVMLGLAFDLLRDPPQLLVCVDFGAFNLRMLEWLRFCGYRGKTLYYFPPGAWFDNAAQARKVARVATPLTPLQHQASFYKSLGLPVEYFGHPLLSIIRPRPERPVGAVPLVAVMPGSRQEEVDLHLPALAETARRMTQGMPARFAVVAASDALASALCAAWPAEGGGASAITRADAAPVLADADVAWVASGTAVLETALRGVPQIAFYRIGDAQYRFVERHVPWLIKGPVTLPNLVLRERIVPELMQDDLGPDRLLPLTNALLHDAARRAQMLADYGRLREALGPDDSLDRIAAHVASLLRADGA